MLATCRLQRRDLGVGCSTNRSHRPACQNRFSRPARAGHPRSVSGADGDGKQSCRSSCLPRRPSSARRNNVALHRRGVLASARSLFSAPVAMGNADQSAAIRPLGLPPVSTPINYAGQSGGFAVRLQQGLAPRPRPLTISREVVVVNRNLFIASSCLSCQQTNFNGFRGAP